MSSRPKQVDIVKNTEPLTADQKFNIKLSACIVVAAFILFGLWLAIYSSQRAAKQSKKDAIHQRHAAQIEQFAAHSPLFDSAQMTRPGHGIM